MRKICIKFIKIYQKWSGTKPSKCKMKPTCSNYAMKAIERFGVFKGGFMSVCRLFRCLNKKSMPLDPVPQNLKGDYKWLM